MKNCTAILMLLLMASSVYSRERRHGVSTAAALSVTTSASDSSGDTEEKDSSNESDDQEMETGDDGSDLETDDTMGTDDHDTHNTDMHHDSDDEADDMESDTNRVKNAIRSALKASALKQSQSSLSRMAAALDAGLTPLQTINALLEPAAESGFTASLGSTKDASDLSGAAAGTVVLGTTGATLVADTASGGGILTTSTVPEPATFLLALGGTLALICRRQRAGATGIAAKTAAPHSEPSCSITP